MHLYRLFLLIVLPLRLIAADVEVKMPGADPVKYSEETLAALPQGSLKVKEHDGTEATWTGVSLTALLEKAGVKFGKDLAGYVLVTAADGYRAVFALPEFDPANGAPVAILSSKRDGAPLDVRYAPFRIVFPGDGLHYRHVRQVQKVEVVQL